MRYLEFEKPIERLETKINQINALIDSEGVDLADELAQHKAKLNKQMLSIYKKLSPWQKVTLARHEDRPRSKAFIRGLIKDFQRLRGDRSHGEDRAIITGMGFLRDRRVMIIAQERGHNTQSRVKHNFGCAHPEGYRKAVRCLDLAQRFKMPVLTFIDTPGADPGIASEERGQAEAIASCLQKCLRVKVPTIATIIGEGGSGGAIAIAATDRVMMLSNAVYTLISPEGCSSILWRNAKHVQDAAAALKITSADLLRLGNIDREILEPAGGAHRNPQQTIEAVGDAIYDELIKLDNIPPHELLENRYAKFLNMGQVSL